MRCIRTPTPLGASRHAGVKIVFAGSDGEERTLYYFSTDLSNGGVDKSKFLDFLETLAPGDGLVKSASYLLHNPGFSKVRDFLLAHSAAMVQDDTGIPLARYDAQKWELQPFGKYVGPIPVFRGMLQLEICRTLQERSSDRFRHRLPMEAEPVESAACGQEAGSFEVRRAGRLGARAIAPDPSPTRVYRVATRT